MKTTRYEVTAASSSVISAALALRSKVFAFDADIGADFARELSRSWKRAGIEGVREACDFLVGMVEGSSVPGSADIYVQAADVARGGAFAWR